METAIPTPERFRGYANAIRQFLLHAQQKYPTFLPFQTKSERQGTREWLENLKPIYRRDLLEIEERLATEFEEVAKFWRDDAAFNTARQRVFRYQPTEQPIDRLSGIIDGVADLSHKYMKSRLTFRKIRRFAEAELRWRQGLSLAIANYLDRTSFQITVHAKSTANRVRELLEKLDRELNKTETLFLLDLADWPVMGRRVRKDLSRFREFLADDGLQTALSFRKDENLLNRTTAKEILLANNWAFGNERKDAAFILLGLSAFESPLDLEQKTLERVWAKWAEQKSQIQYANHDAKLLVTDRKTPRKDPFSDPLIPNPSRPTFGD
jgi:hypothetical protein